MALRVSSVARPCVFEVVEDVSKKFNFSAPAQERLIDCLPYFRPERFALPYAEGGELAIERAFGTELRALMSQPVIPAPMFARYDHATFELAGMLEFFDRHGFKRTHKLLRQAAEHDEVPIRSAKPRSNPILPAHALPLMREALACLFESLTGKKPSQKDFAPSNGSALKFPVPGSAADFISTVLTKLGWNYSVRDIRKNYGNIVDLQHRWIAN